MPLIIQIRFARHRQMHYIILFYAVISYDINCCFIIECINNAPTYTERFQYSFFMVAWVMRLNDDIKYLSCSVLFCYVLFCDILLFTVIFFTGLIPPSKRTTLNSINRSKLKSLPAPIAYDIFL